MQCNLSCLYYYTVTVDLIADGLAIPVGYVVPEWRNITFTCNSSLGGLFWNFDLKVPGETVSLIASAGLAHQVSQVTSPDTSQTANPATITIHNVTSKNNESTVVCSSTITDSKSDSATILVEGGDVSTAPCIHAQSCNGKQGSVSVNKSRTCSTHCH